MGITDFKPRSSRALVLLDKFSEGALPGARQRVHLLPGELHASSEPCRINTILGSCVAVCLFDTTLRIGGMNHFLLPISHGPEAGSLRFADHAMLALLENLMAMGCRREDLVAKVFGGAALFQNTDRYCESLGAKNVAATAQLLQNAGIPILACDTGGNYSRKVIFDTEEGTVWSRHI